MKTLGIHHEGWNFFALFFITSIVFYFIVAPFAYLMFGLCLFTLYFFRDPDRITPDQANAIISPADGTICQIKTIHAPDEVGFPADQKCLKVSIFMNVFNVHVNRSPMNGKVIHDQYIQGRFFNASFDKASEHNERHALRIATHNGQEIGMVQIAGLIARRIIQWLPDNKQLRCGQRFGLIRFGSRVDLYLPTDTTIDVTLGQKVKAGETIIGQLEQS